MCIPNKAYQTSRVEKCEQPSAITEVLSANQHYQQIPIIKSNNNNKGKKGEKHCHLMSAKINLALICDKYN